MDILFSSFHRFYGFIYFIIPLFSHLEKILNRLLAYICKITKHFALGKIRRNKAIKRSDNLSVSFDELSDMISGVENPEEVYDVKEISKSISEFLLTQKQIERQIFVRRYWYCDSIETIAEQFKINARSTATILFRMRKKLKKYLIKGGYEL